jgi:hypothetical protein
MKTLNVFVVVGLMVTSGAAVRLAPDVAWPVLTHLASATLFAALYHHLQDDKNKTTN